MHAIDAISILYILTSWPALLLFLAAVCIFLVYRGAYRDLMVLLIGLLITQICVFILKRIWQVPRPTEALFELSDYAFPSGHAAMSAALMVLMLTLVYRHIPRLLREIYIVFWIVVAVIVGYSRLMFGVHRIEEVIAGFIIGSVIALLCVRLLAKEYPKWWI